MALVSCAAGILGLAAGIGAAAAVVVGQSGYSVGANAAELGALAQQEFYVLGTPRHEGGHELAPVGAIAGEQNTAPPVMASLPAKHSSHGAVQALRAFSRCCWRGGI